MIRERPTHAVVTITTTRGTANVAITTPFDQTNHTAHVTESKDHAVQVLQQDFNARFFNIIFYTIKL